MLNRIQITLFFLIGLIPLSIDAQDTLNNKAISYTISLPDSWMKTDSIENKVEFADSTGQFKLRIKVIQREDEVSAFMQLKSIDSFYRETGFYSDLKSEDLSSFSDSSFLADKNCDEVSATNYYHENDPGIIQAVLVFRKKNQYIILNYRFPYSQTQTAENYFSVLFRTFRINDF